MVAVNDHIGVRSADLIWQYSLYLSALPLVTSMAGLTTCMFVVEGTVANAYLLYIARKFRQEQTNANARKIFLCSLWYLPLLLAGFVFHSKNWDDNSLKENEGQEDKVGGAIMMAKQFMKDICVHEIIVNKDDLNSPGLCPKVATDKVKMPIFC